MNTWGKVAAGVILGVAGTIYATSEEARKNLPKTARELPTNVRRRYESAVSAAREASRRSCASSSATTGPTPGRPPVWSLRPRQKKWRRQWPRPQRRRRSSRPRAARTNHEATIS